MRLLGAELALVEPGRVEITLPYRADLCQQNGYLHAGISTTIADTAGGYAAYSLFEPGQDVLTSEFKMNFLAPAKGERYTATGRVVKPGRRLSICQVEVHAHAQDQATLCVIGLLTAVSRAVDPLRCVGSASWKGALRAAVRRASGAPWVLSRIYEQIMPAKEHHRIFRSNWLRAAVLGANDGIVSTASLITGVAAAQAAHGAILTSGLAGLVAGALSMAAGEYVSVRSQADTEAADLRLEQRSLKRNSGEELAELTEIYVQRGLSPDLAAQVASQLTHHDALDAHARDELGILLHNRAVRCRRPWRRQPVSRAARPCPWRWRRLRRPDR